MNSGFVKVRRGMRDHITDGRIDSDMCAAFLVILMDAEHQTAIWSGSGARLAEIFHWNKRKGQRVYRRLIEGGYIEPTANLKRPGTKPVLVPKYFRSENEAENSVRSPVEKPVEEPVENVEKTHRTATQQRHDSDKTGRSLQETATRQGPILSLTASENVTVIAASEAESERCSAEEVKKQEVILRNKKEELGPQTSRPVPDPPEKIETKSKTGAEITTLADLTHRVAKIAAQHYIEPPKRVEKKPPLTTSQQSYSNVAILVRIALPIMRDARNRGQPIFDADVKEAIKCAAAQRRISYDGDKIGQAMEIAAQKLKQEKP